MTVCGEAENGREAIEKAQALYPDLIMMDLSMPVVNGIEAARTLKRLMPTVPIIMFSEYCTLGDLQDREDTARRTDEPSSVPGTYFSSSSQSHDSHTMVVGCAENHSGNSLGKC